MDVVSSNKAERFVRRRSIAERPSVPGAGRTIQSAAEERAVHIRRAVQVLENGFKEGADASFAKLFAPRWLRQQYDHEPVLRRAGWALTNMLLIARFESASHDLESAEQWFLQDQGGTRLSRCVDVETRREAEKYLDLLDFDDDLAELLPYALEAHGPGSRLSVMRDPSTKAARDAKRKCGVFYTPADVAEYIVEAVGSSLSSGARYIDPCCGTGVFLLALLRKSQGGLAYLIDHLHGVDASPLSVESCAFVLLHACRGTYTIPPWHAWHLIRSNLFAYDSLRLRDWACHKRDELALHKLQIQRRLLAGRVPGSFDTEPPNTMESWTAPGHRSIWEVFPNIGDGFDAVVGNPPYASIGARDDKAALADYEALPAYSTTANLFPLFVELMWRLTNRSASCSGLVTPLSIAFHQGRQFKACRRAMWKAGGHWKCAFFDREPHALFGEDVKTRNAILFRMDGKVAKRRLSVTSLLKWTSRTRDQLFRNIQFADLGQHDFEDAIPKLGSNGEAIAFSKLHSGSERLALLCQQMSTCLPSEATKETDEPRVFVASTAYNFLNVFRSISDIAPTHPLSENKVHCLAFATEQDARLAFAVLSSRLTYWQWHSMGDGFHVSRKFLEEIPFSRNSFGMDSQIQLELLGDDLWKELQAHQIMSVNRGRQTIAFRPHACTSIRDAIDEILVDAARLSPAFVNTLRSFVEKIIVVDSTDKRRSHLKKLVSSTEV